MTPFDLLVCALACWRLAYLLAYEAAPFGILSKLRARYSTPDKPSLLNCPACASVWTAALVLALWLLTGAIGQALVAVCAVSAAALMLASYSGANRG